MRSKSHFAWISAAVAASLLFGATARAERIPRVELLRVVEVAGARLSLSDLLPASAPADLRARAENIPLGSSPQPGNTRILSASAVERTAGADPDVLENVVVPARMMVSRGARPITLDEVFTAIRAALTESGMPAAETLRPQDILWQTQILVSPGDSGLEVLRMDADPGLSRVRFLLWPSQDPKVVPFLVTARLAGDLTALSLPRPAGAGKPILQTVVSPAHGAAKPEIAKPEILVVRGQVATLVLHSGALRMIVDVTSLEGGTLGQRIQVRTLDGDKVFRAQVDGRAHLEVAF